VELAVQARRNRSLTMHINKMHSVRTWLGQIAIEMEPEDGLIWVYGPDQEYGVMAFSEFGIESLQNLIAIHRDGNK
jgi:hypothetical protein